MFIRFGSIKLDIGNKICSTKGSKYDLRYPGSGKMDPVLPKSLGGTRPNICIYIYIDMAVSRLIALNKTLKH